ncbi:hypothetical protein [Salisaeta longa]|uniref:hypothetical protein n=1 Tax=Salisaeta longa TaxID=503170 RepID=UPI0003B4E1D5|nr:hypothetical protein [Salisaeta longa]
MRIKTFLLSLISLGLPFVVQAQEAESHRTISVEVNPLAYAFTGWSIGGTYQPSNLKRWVFNAGAYGFQMPEFFVDQIPGNEDEGFELQIQSAFTIGTDFHPWNRDRAGIAFGISTVIANFQVTNENEDGEADYSSLYVVPRASYTWFLFDGLYVMPWLGLEIHNKVSGRTQVGSLDFEPMSVQLSPNISIGYAF